MNGDVYREAAPYYVEVWLKYLMHMKLPFYFESITHYVAFCYLLLLSSATSPWRWAAFQESMDMPPFFRCLKTQPGCQSTKNFRPVSNLPYLSKILESRAVAVAEVSWRAQYDAATSVCLQEIP